MKKKLHKKIVLLKTFADISYQSQKNYNLNFIFMIFGNLLGAVINYLIWYNVFLSSNTNNMNGYSLNEILPYYLLVTIVQLILFQDTDFYVSKDIKDGNIVFSLTKPISFYLLNLSKTFGSALFYVIYICSPIILLFLIYVIFFNIKLLNFAYFFLFFISTSCGFYIIFEFEYLFGLFSFITMSNWGISKFKLLLIEFLSGSAIPIFMLPQIFLNIVKCLPFYYSICFPVEILLQKKSLNEILFGLIIQILWIILFHFLIKKIWNKVVHYISINGG